MPSTFTDNTGIEKIADGEQSGLWGQTTNLNFDIIDRALNGSVEIALSGTTHTLTTTSGVLSDGQFAVLVFGGSPSGTNTVTIAPNTAQKTYFVVNNSGEDVILTQGSGDSVTVSDGETDIIVADGAGAGASVVSVGGGAAGVAYVAKTANFTTRSNEGVLADTTGGAFTVTLPLNPSLGDQVIIADNGGAFDTNNLTVGRNGETIEGVAQDLILDIRDVSVQLVYDGATWQVYAQVGGAGGDVVTLTGTQTLTNKTLKNYAIEGSALGNTGAAATFDLSVANFFSATLDQNSTFTFTNPPTSGSFSGFVLELTNGGAFTITYPTSVNFVDGAAPALTAAGVDLLVFVTRDGGTTFLGLVAGLDIK